VIAAAGLGVFLWADVVIGAVDNREARVFINSACARTRRTWVDGAIEGLSGIVRVFSPHSGACYECTMNATDRKLLAERRSCAMLARDAVRRGHVPTSAVAASVVGAMQVQEAIKVVHGQPTLVGQGLHLDGLFGEVSRVAYPARPDCPGHEDLGAIVPLGVGVNDITVGALLDRADAALGASGAARRAAPRRPAAPCSAPCASRRPRARAAARTACSTSPRRSAAMARSISRGRRPSSGSPRTT
jgi:adenylyltransferase/sulfurtransferase